MTLTAYKQRVYKLLRMSFEAKPLSDNEERLVHRIIRTSQAMNLLPELTAQILASDLGLTP